MPFVKAEASHGLERPETKQSFAGICAHFDLPCEAPAMAIFSRAQDIQQSNRVRAKSMLQLVTLPGIPSEHAILGRQGCHSAERLSQEG